MVGDVLMHDDDDGVVDFYYTYTTTSFNLHKFFYFVAAYHMQVRREYLCK